MIAHRPGAEDDLHNALASAIEPRALMRPSDWAERHVMLTTEQSESMPGPFRCSWRPWTRAIHDVMHDEPQRAGVVCVKPARVGFTRAVMNVMGCYADRMPGPMLFLIDTREQATFWATEHLDKLVQSVAPLRESFAQAAADRRETTVQRPFVGGRIDLAGGGTASSVISRGYRFAFLDEYDQLRAVFPRDAGDPFTMARARVSAAHDGQVWVWSHPRNKGEGTSDLYDRLSDCRAWVFNCPHCAAAVEPHSTLVYVEGVNERNEPDVGSAVMRCGACGEVITDRQRRTAVWPPELGGTGRFELSGRAVELDGVTAADAERREFVGLAINGLANPYLTVAQFIRGKLEATDEAELKTWHNIVAGEPYEAAHVLMSPELVRQAVQSVDRIVVPGGEHGTLLCTTGVDVQAPGDRLGTEPTLYVATIAWGMTGTQLVVDLRTLNGWESLTAYLEELAVPVADGDRELRPMAPLACGIDCGYMTRRVLDYCRGAVFSRVTAAQVQMIPLRYVKHLDATTPAVEPSLQKRIDPARPHLGAQHRWDLHRHTWVHRQLMKWSEGRTRVLCKPPDVLPDHVTANVLAQVGNVHRYGGEQRTEWVKIPKRRDDYLQACCYAETVAVLDCGLERQRETRRLPQQKPPARADSWTSKGQTGRSWWR